MKKKEEGTENTLPSPSSEGEVVSLLHVGRIDALHGCRFVAFVPLRPERLGILMSLGIVLECVAVEIETRALGNTHSIVGNVGRRDVRVAQTDWWSPTPGFFDDTSDLESKLSARKLNQP